MIAVASDCRNEARRAIARATWVPAARRLGFDVVFIVGSHSECDRPSVPDESADQPGQQAAAPRIISEIDAERAANGGDVVGLPVPESYANLPKKTLALIQWAADHSPPIDLLFKADDDVFVDAARLLQRLRLLTDRDIRQGAGTYMGYFHNDSKPDPRPGSKWSDPVYEATVGAQAPYMPYAAGPFYGLSQPAIAFLGRAGAAGALRTDWKNEDVSVGQWLHGTAVHRHHEEGMLRYLEGSTGDRGRVPYALHMQSYQEVLPGIGMEGGVERGIGGGTVDGRTGSGGGRLAQRAVRGVHGGSSESKGTGSESGSGRLSYRSEQGGLSRWERDEWLAVVADAVAARVAGGGLVRGRCCGS